MATRMQKHEIAWASTNFESLKLGMQVTVKLFGALREFLPAGSGFNSCQLKIDADQLLGDILKQLPIPAHKPYLVIVNDEKVNAQDLESVQVKEDDEIVLLPPIKGG